MTVKIKLVAATICAIPPAPPARTSIHIAMMKFSEQKSPPQGPHPLVSRAADMPVWCYSDLPWVFLSDPELFISKPSDKSIHCCGLSLIIGGMCGFRSPSLCIAARLLFMFPASLWTWPVKDAGMGWNCQCIIIRIH